MVWARRMYACHVCMSLDAGGWWAHRLERLGSGREIRGAERGEGVGSSSRAQAWSTKTTTARMPVRNPTQGVPTFRFPNSGPAGPHHVETSPVLFLPCFFHSDSSQLSAMISHRADICLVEIFAHSKRKHDKRPTWRLSFQVTAGSRGYWLQGSLWLLWPRFSTADWELVRILVFAPLKHTLLHSIPRLLS